MVREAARVEAVEARDHKRRLRAAAARRRRRAHARAAERLETDRALGLAGVEMGVYVVCT